MRNEIYGSPLTIVLKSENDVSFKMGLWVFYGLANKIHLFDIYRCASFEYYCIE